MVFYLGGASLARREWISLPYELACASGSRLDPMSLRAERDHLVIGLAWQRLCRRTVITPRLASIPNSFIKSGFVLVSLVKPSVASWANARHIVFPRHFHAQNAAFSFNLVRHRHISKIYRPVFNACRLVEKYECSLGHAVRVTKRNHPLAIRRPRNQTTRRDTMKLISGCAESGLCTNISIRQRQTRRLLWRPKHPASKYNSGSKDENCKNENDAFHGSGAEMPNRY